MESVVLTVGAADILAGWSEVVTWLGHIHFPHLLPITPPAQTIWEAVLEAPQRDQCSAPAEAMKPNHAPCDPSSLTEVTGSSPVAL